MGLVSAFPRWVKQVSERLGDLPVRMHSVTPSSGLLAWGLSPPTQLCHPLLVLTPSKIQELGQELGQRERGHWGPGFDPKFLFIILVPETAT